VSTFKFMYPNRKPFRDGKTGSRPTAAAASYILWYRYITRTRASRQIAIFFPDDDALLFCQFSKQFVQLYCSVVTRGPIIIIIVIHYIIIYDVRCCGNDLVFQRLCRRSTIGTGTGFGLLGKVIFERVSRLAGRFQRLRSCH